MNYMLVIRRFRRYKSSYIFMIVGLVIGLTTFLLTTLSYLFEHSYDEYGDKDNKIFRIETYTKDGSGFARTTYGVAPLISNKIGDEKQVGRITRLFNQDAVIKFEEKKFKQDELYFIEDQTLGILEFDLKYEATITENATSKAIISETTALAYFGSLDVIGKQIIVNLNNKNRTYHIANVFKVQPINRHFKPEILLPLDDVFTFLNPRTSSIMKSWYTYNFWTYLKIDPNSATSILEGIVDEHFPESRRDTELRMKPVQEIHLNSHLDFEFEKNADIAYVNILFMVGILTLLLSTVNHINLNIAHIAKLESEFDLRKILGADNARIFIMMIVELSMVLMISMMFVTSDNYFIKCNFSDRIPRTRHCF